MPKDIHRTFPEKIISKRQTLFVIIILYVLLVADLPLVAGTLSSDLYSYKFIVDENGLTKVYITFRSTANEGASWVIVPKKKFTSWKYTYAPLDANIKSDIGKTEDYVNQDYYFYEVFVFSFNSESTFQLQIQFDMKEGALIIEREDAFDGMFLSPLIGFNPESLGRAEVIFPDYFEVQEVDPSPSKVAGNSVSFDSLQFLTRLQIQFETGKAPDPVSIEHGIFTFNTVERYENYAQKILNIYNKTYDDLTDLFNVTLSDVTVQFFIPDFDMLLSVGGYVPFVRQKLGEININIFFVRAINGTIEVIALHELIHHFLWRAALSPDYFLWFHEGMAQFVSIKIIEDLNFEGAAEERRRLEQGISQLILPTKDLGFLEEWTPEHQPRKTSELYVASYYVVKTLADKYGGLDLYKQFFKQIHGLKYKPGGWKPNEWLAFHLSWAVNKSVDVSLKLLGFDINLVYTEEKIPPQLIYETEKAIDGLSLVFQPYKLIAEFLYQQALLRLERGDIDGANQLLNIALAIANLAPLLTLLTLVAIFAIIVYILHKHLTQTTVEIPSIPPVYEETNV
jgi:hypothetical protein